MGFEYLIDTNILIYFIENKIPENEFKKVNKIVKSSFNISCMTKIELLSWKKLEEYHFIELKKFLSNSTVFLLNEDLIEKTILLRKNHGIKTPDAIIGATALNNDLILVTRNVKDFKKINGLNIYNPFDRE